MKTRNNQTNLTVSVLVLTIAIASCSSLSPEAQESLSDLRSTLPGPLRGDNVPLTEQPMPTLSGNWVDKNFPELALSLKQSGSAVTINRTGTRNTLKVTEEINLQLNGRAAKGKYVNRDPNQIRATSGSCNGSVSKNSQAINLTCTYGGNTFPLSFVNAN